MRDPHDRWWALFGFILTIAIVITLEHCHGR